MSDTVGFVRDLPHMLVAAFKSTLQEAMDADLLLHVLDSSSPSNDDQASAVKAVLAEIDAADIPQWIVHNKIDQSGHRAGYIAVPTSDDETQSDGSVASDHHFYVSGLTGEGLPELRAALIEAARHHRMPELLSKVSQSELNDYQQGAIYFAPADNA
jgi:GTP-binding protein HflX